MSKTFKDSKKTYNEAYDKRREESKRDEERAAKEAQRRAWFNKQDSHEQMDDQARRNN